MKAFLFPRHVQNTGGKSSTPRKVFSQNFVNYVHVFSRFPPKFNPIAVTCERNSKTPLHFQKLVLSKSYTFCRKKLNFF